MTVGEKIKEIRWCEDNGHLYTRDDVRWLLRVTEIAVKALTRHMADDFYFGTGPCSWKEAREALEEIDHVA
jgi:hypothetical protein